MYLYFKFYLLQLISRYFVQAILMGRWYDTVVRFLWRTCLDISQLNYTCTSKGCCKLLFPTKSLLYLAMPALTTRPPCKAPQWLSLSHFGLLRFIRDSFPVLLHLPFLRVCQLSPISHFSLKTLRINHTVICAVCSCRWCSVPTLTVNQSPVSLLASNHFSVHCYSMVSNNHHKLWADCNDTVNSRCKFMCGKYY